MNKQHLVRVAVLTAFPCLLLAANASAPSRPGNDERTKAAEAPALPLLAWADFDADGRADAFAVHPDGTGALYRGTKSGNLTLVTADLGLSALPALRAASWEDVNSDGLQDLLVVLADGGARLFVNDGSGFADATDGSGLELEGVLAARWGDHDADGAPDLVTSTAAGYRVHRNLGGGFFESVALEAPAQSEHGISEQGMPPGIASPTDVVLPAALPAAAGTPASESPSDSARGGRHPVLPVDVALAGGGTAKLVAPATVFGAQALPWCMQAMDDMASSACINASSLPTLGMLYPLSVDLNVDADGQVGIGTTNATSKLEVNAAGGERALEASASGDVTAAILASAGVSNPTLEVRSAGFAGELAGRVEQGYRTGAPGFFFRPRVVLDSEDAGNGRLRVVNDSGDDAATLRAGGSGTFGAELGMLNNDADQTVRLGSNNAFGAGYLLMTQLGGTRTIDLSAHDFSTPGSVLSMDTSAGFETVELLSEEGPGNGAQLTLRTADGIPTIVLDAQLGTITADLGMYTSTGVKSVELRPEEVAGNGAQLLLRKADGTTSIVLDAEQNGDGRITTEVLEITGGADLVESFDTGDAVCAPGSVVVIDANRPGELALSSRPYDGCVAGVVSGAGGVRAGLHMGQTGVATGDTPVALTGRVHVLCTSENGPIQPGDLLTSSSTPGHAMRATDRDRSFGTVIGKAMTSLAEGESGLVLVLVNLQ